MRKGEVEVEVGVADTEGLLELEWDRSPWVEFVGICIRGLAFFPAVQGHLYQCTHTSRGRSIPGDIRFSSMNRPEKEKYT